MVYNITIKIKGEFNMNESSQIKTEYSSRRPENMAWRVESDGHVTYGKTRELALELHRSKLEVCDQINQILAKCASAPIA